ncbi:PIG-L family deacetylase [Deinococcus metallilatus]|uniref:LmbE family N-acetylglucosaminyl deacetylase n=1 Tax=Deinococcus metallilatus TaxID=1211322 RepID=A0AAJ5F393_9DEIO|nr:PIG-L family deacetylase [Deinococcus metallilatus]MBB5294122.1 LmbE family N-acetylglucosaminyl deacetylase [Deinococcus metallilatus]QBY08906.1 PIG-L family deacetylase [Deinococcus metallilatus]RXJ10050.1 PIG-L family deacetylase [Deinococcus metallilatus]TLK28013.1 PIG-L family deacetylase [Deinococcus metallilatus]GMA16542.1 PIG-L domain-containing protein [Deinococcus metallilatus]
MSRRLRAAVLTAGLLLTAAFVINTTGALRLFYPRAAGAVAALPAVAPYHAGERVLIVAPHPDDETLCCAGSVLQAQAAGAQVWVVWLTSGDGFEFDAVLLEHAPRPSSTQFAALGARRTREAARAMQVLNVPPDHLIFLGYPDGGLLHLFLEHYAQPYTSRYTRAAHVPYPQALTPGAPYTGRSVERDLARVLDRVKPDRVLAPSVQDAHPDHRAASYFVTRLLAARGEERRLRFWVVHGGLEYPLPKGLHPRFPLLIAPRGRSLAWERLDLTPDQEDAKRRALLEHRSQMDVLGRFLLAFVRENELLTPQVAPARRKP